MEEERADALEMAEKAHKERKKKTQDEIIMGSTVSKARLDRYFNITAEALEKVKLSKLGNVCFDPNDIAKDFLDMANRYYHDAEYFRKKGDMVTAFAAVTYAHAWLDAGARLGLFNVKDTRLFAAD